MTLNVRSIALAAACAVLPLSSLAQADDPMAKAARKALETNPDVTARVNALRASLDAVERGARGLAAARRCRSRRRAHRRQHHLAHAGQRHARHNGVALSISQLLWDGTALTTQIRRLDHDRQTRWFELLDVSELTALDAVRAYIDVARFRRLVELAEDSYVDHRFYYRTDPVALSRRRGPRRRPRAGGGTGGIGRIEPDHRDVKPARRGGALSPGGGRGAVAKAAAARLVRRGAAGHGHRGDGPGAAQQRRHQRGDRKPALGARCRGRARERVLAHARGTRARRRRAQLRCHTGSAAQMSPQASC